MNSMICAMRSVLSPAKRLLCAAATLLVLAGILSGERASTAAADESETQAFFMKFIAAQNAHSAEDVKAMLWNSPSMLSYSRGVETRGADAVATRFNEYYQGTWHLEPDMSQFRAAAITSDVTQILVPIAFTRALPGNPPLVDTFLISQTFVRGANGWHVASILPIANTQLK
jgi:hypothetical protein